jgi:hypothetical protein
LPWKRGPAAWQVAIRAEQILHGIKKCPRRFQSLRKAAALLGLSTQPLRDWIKRGYLQRGGQRYQISNEELSRFVIWLKQRAKPYDPEKYVERFYSDEGQPLWRFGKLESARFAWPKGRDALRPKELSDRIGCHSSLIVRAISAGRVFAERRSPHRWEITKGAWRHAFMFSLIRTPRKVPLPNKELVPTVDVMWHLRACGIARINQAGVREMIREGQLHGLRPTPGGRKLFVSRTSLKNFVDKWVESA